MTAREQIRMQLVAQKDKAKKETEEFEKRLDELPLGHPSSRKNFRIVYDYLIKGYREGDGERQIGATEFEIHRVFRDMNETILTWVIRAMHDGGYIRQYGPKRDGQKVWVKSDLEL